MIRLLARLFAAVLFSKEPEITRIIFTRCRVVGITQTRVLPNRKQIQQGVVVLPARISQSSTACGGKVVQQLGTYVHFSGAIKM